MNILDTLKSFWGKYKLTIILGLVSIAAIILLCISVSKYMQLNAKYKNNVKALTEQVEFYETSNGQLVAEKTALTGDISDLKLANSQLLEKIKELEIKKPQQIVYVETEIINEVHDTSYVVDPTLSYQKKEFNFNNDWRTLEGFMELKDNSLGLSITQDKMFADYTVAFKDNKVYVTSKNPYIQYNNIEGFTMPQQKKKAFSLTVGPSFGGGYGILNKQWDLYAGASIVFGFNLLQL